MPELVPDKYCFLDGKMIAKWTGYWHGLRRVMVSGKLTEESLNKAALEIIMLDYDERAPITLMINSGGGDVIPTHQFEDMINSIKSPVDAIVIGNCASMAVDLVQMCRKRQLLPSSRMLVHYIRNSQPWIVDDLERLDTDLRYFREEMAEIKARRLALYERRTGLTPQKLEEMFRYGEVHHAYLSAKQAVEQHLADEVVTDFKLFHKRHDE